MKNQLPNFNENDLCNACKGHEYIEDHFIRVKFIPKDEFSPSMMGVPVHNSHFNEVVDGSDTFYRKDGRYIKN